MATEAYVASFSFHVLNVRKSMPAAYDPERRGGKAEQGKRSRLRKRSGPEIKRFHRVKRIGFGKSLSAVAGGCYPKII